MDPHRMRVPSFLSPQDAFGFPLEGTTKAIHLRANVWRRKTVRIHGEPADGPINSHCLKNWERYPLETPLVLHGPNENYCDSTLGLVNLNMNIRRSTLQLTLWDQNRTGAGPSGQRPQTGDWRFILKPRVSSLQPISLVPGAGLEPA